jgi:excinuclease ABC subunit C
MYFNWNGKHLGYKHFIQNIDDNDNSNNKENILTTCIACIEQQPDYIHNRIDNLRILSEVLDSSSWQYIHEFMPYLKPYKSNHSHVKSWQQDANLNAELHLKQFFSSQNNIKQQISALNELVSLNTINPHIECFDISHTSGDFTKASCVVFKDANFDRKNFRHYNLELPTKSDDYEAMRQAVTKRYKNINIEELPSLILIDGGLGQVNAVIQAFQELNLPIDNIIGISKGEKRKVGLETIIFADGRDAITPTLSNLGLVLLTKIRDTAHDYAVLNMRKTRERKHYTSALEDIEGIGSVKKKRLIAHFGGIQGIAQATENELMQVHGINQELAERIYNYFHHHYN